MRPQHMSPDQFREYGHAMVDWVAEYWERLAELPVASPAGPGEVAAELPGSPPDTAESFVDILKDVDRVVVPGLTNWQHPRFFAYFPANTSGPSVLADLLCAGLGVQGMLWVTSPACTELETVMLDWLRQALDLPRRFHSGGAGGGVIQDSASSAVLVALLAALHRTAGEDWRRNGSGPRYRVYASAEAHSSVVRAVRIAGIGDDQLREVPVDPVSRALDAGALRRMVAEDRAAGHVPVLVVATAGTTSTTGFDPMPEIGAICREAGLWLHVDAAYAGAAAVCPELRWVNRGVEHADSYCFNPHKWLLTGFDCTAFWVADRTALTGALAVVPEFLRNAASDTAAVIDYRDWQVPLARRFRALKLWFVLRWYGIEGLRQHIRHHVGLAATLAGWIGADPRFEILAPHPLSLVCFGLRGAGADRRTEALLRRCNESGVLMVSHTRIGDRYAIRLAIGAPATTEEHLRLAWQQIQRLAEGVEA